MKIKRPTKNRLDFGQLRVNQEEVEEFNVQYNNELNFLLVFNLEILRKLSLAVI